MGPEKRGNSARASSSRRDFLKKSFAAAASVPLSGGSLMAEEGEGSANGAPRGKRPNVVIIMPSSSVEILSVQTARIRWP